MPDEINLSDVRASKLAAEVGEELEQLGEKLTEAQRRLIVDAAESLAETEIAPGPWQVGIRIHVAADDGDDGHATHVGIHLQTDVA